MSDQSKLIKKSIPEPFNILVIGIFLLLSFFALFDFLLKGIITDILTRSLLYLLILFGWVLFWLIRKFRFPKAKKNKAGIIIAVKTEKKKQHNRIKNDFVERLNNLASGHDLLKSVEFMSLNDYYSLKAINVLNDYRRTQDECRKKEKELGIIQKPKINKGFQRFKKQTRSYFYIWGSVKEGIDLENKYFLDLNAMVTHRPVSLEISDRLKEDFCRTFLNRISFLEKFEVRGFEASADHIFLVVQFITGMAALISGNPFIALELHRRLEKELGKLPALPDKLNYMVKKCKELIAEEWIHVARIECLYNRDKNKAISAINNSLAVKPDNYEAFVFSSYIEFDEGNGSVDNALEWVEKAKQTLESKSNYTWLYNEAFLFMHLEDFPRALNDYRKLSKLNYKDEEYVLEDVMGYIKKFLEKKPEKIQYLFVLGYLYDKKYDNVSMALKYFDKFIEKAKTEDRYKLLLEVADVYKSEIEKGIGVK